MFAVLELIIILIAIPFVMKPNDRYFIPFLVYFGLCSLVTPFVGIPLYLYIYRDPR